MSTGLANYNHNFLKPDEDYSLKTNYAFRQEMKAQLYGSTTKTRGWI
jgi:hypothetical protein